MQNDLISRSALGIGRCNPDAFPEQNRGYVAGWNGVVALIEAAPAVDAVSRSVFEQVKWERDCAMQQLKDHGIPFGGIAPDVVKVVRCGECIHRVYKEIGDCKIGGCELLGVALPCDFYCAEGKRRADNGK